jgi:hypothetical protein
MNGKSRGPEPSVKTWRQAAVLLAICNEHRKAAKKEPVVDAGLRVRE